MLQNGLFLSLCASRKTSFSLLTLSNCQAGTVSSFSIPCPLLLSPPEFSSLEASEEMCEPSCNESLNYALCLWCDLRGLSGRDDSKRFLVDSWASTMHACFGFGILLNSALFASVSWYGKCFFVPFLHGIAASIGTNLPLRFRWFLCFSPSSGWMIKIPLSFPALSTFGFW